MVFTAIFTRFKSNLKLLGALLGKVKEVSQSAHEKGWKNRQSIIESPQLCPNLNEYCYSSEFPHEIIKTIEGKYCERKLNTSTQIAGLYLCVIKETSNRF